MDSTNANREFHTKKRGGFFFHLLIVIFSVLFLFLGNKIATKNLSLSSEGTSEQDFIKAKVEKIVNKSDEEYSLDEKTTLKNTLITFKAVVLAGTNKGKSITGTQNKDSMYSASVPDVKVGDKILLSKGQEQEGAEWQFIEFVRTDKLLILTIFFVFALLLFGRIKGFNTVISLLLTCAAIFAVFVPSILSGKNIYISSIIICLYTIIMTYLIVNGWNKKTLASILGCLGGIIISGVLTIIMDKALTLTGYVSEESVYLTDVSTKTPINLNAIIFASILIGAMGAIMDVSMSITSSLWEVKEKSGFSSVNVIFKSGMNIGRDIMGTMANTLILAYIGSSLSSVLLFTAYSTSLTYLLNREMIVVEVLQALVGSFGIIFTIPLTSIICSIIYTKNTKHER